MCSDLMSVTIDSRSLLLSADVSQMFLIIKASLTCFHQRFLETPSTATHIQKHLLIIIITWTHGGVCGAVPVRDGHVVVVESARDPFSGFCFPQKRVEIREVVMDVQTVLTPASQRPAAELRSLRDHKPDERLKQRNLRRFDFNQC